MPNVKIYVSDTLGQYFSCSNFQNYKELEGQLKSRREHEFYQENPDLLQPALNDEEVASLLLPWKLLLWIAGIWNAYHFNQSSY